MSWRAIIASDGKRGHENQSRVVASMLGDQDPLIMRLRDKVKEGGLAELMLRLTLRFRGGRNAFRQGQAAALVAQYLQPEENEALRDLAFSVRDAEEKLRFVVISAGTPPATFNLILTRMLGAMSIAIMTPSLLPRSLFDLNIVPRHDIAEGNTEPNILATSLALSHHDETKAVHAASRLRSEYGVEDGPEYWGVAIGGPSKACPWVGDRILDELGTLHGLAKGEGTKLLITTSRRTPLHIVNWLKNHFVGSPNVAMLLDASEDDFNPLPGFYELCKRIMVSVDSFSMVSEAIQAGHQPVMLNVRIGRPPGKLGRAYLQLKEDEKIIAGNDAEDLPDRLARQKERGETNQQYNAVRDTLLHKLSQLG